MSVVRRKRSNTARLERYAAVSECGQQSPAESQPRPSTQDIARDDKRVRVWFRSRMPSVSGLRRKRNIEGLTSRLRASSRAWSLECLIGRGAVQVPCKVYKQGLGGLDCRGNWQKWLGSAVGKRGAGGDGKLRRDVECFRRGMAFPCDSPRTRGVAQ